MKILFITTWYPTKFNPVAGIFVREHAKAVNLFNKVVVLHSSTEILNLKGLYKIEQEGNKDITEGIPTYRFLLKRIPIKIISYIIFISGIMKMN